MVQRVPARDMRVSVTAQAGENRHMPLVHETFRFLKQMYARHHVESGVPFTTDSDRCRLLATD